MITLPPIPSWDALHPLVVHFPIALLLTAPVFVVIGAIRGAVKGRPYFMAALVLMALGTAGAWVAVATGDAAEEQVQENAQTRAALEQHQNLGEATRLAFTILTALFAALVFALGLDRNATRSVSTIAAVAFLALYAAGSVLLANTSHQSVNS
ncbi:MAG TPA: DUF2231 domain-containing protein [Thermoanaerobaculia bacterium]|nr:DUF2231 domain-containing protein [Thermoanaerobaculia bacterium]